uniref:Uncharacterized protein n=1 Tax=Panagrolaimus sp. JU765 TaxID=591449 RepID=A0AC34QE52_9BILA
MSFKPSKSATGQSRIIKAAMDNGISTMKAITWAQIQQTYEKQYGEKLDTRAMKYYFNIPKISQLLLGLMSPIFCIVNGFFSENP